MKKILLTILLGISLTLSITPLVLAQTASTTTGKSGSDASLTSGGIRSTVDAIGSKTPLPSFDAGHANQNYQAGASQLTSVIYFMLDFLKYILGGIATIMIIISGLKLIMSARTVSDAMSKEKETLRFAFMGLIIIIISDQLIRTLFGSYGETLRSGEDMKLTAGAVVNVTQGLTGLLRIFIPTLAIMYFVLAAFKLLNSRGDADKLNKAKTQITWSVLGIILAGLAEILVFRVVFPDQGMRIPDTVELAKLLVTITNFISGFISTIAVSYIIYAGYLYVISRGTEGVDKAKKMVSGAIIGLLIAMAAFGLVNTFVRIPPAKTTTTNNASTPVPSP